MRADINLQTIRDIGRADPTHLSSALAERMHGSTTFAVASAAPLSAGLDGTPIVPADVVMAQPSSDRTKKRVCHQFARAVAIDGLWPWCSYGLPAADNPVNTLSFGVWASCGWCVVVRTRRNRQSSSTHHSLLKVKTLLQSLIATAHHLRDVCRHLLGTLPGCHGRRAK